jgi:hypothetical protein
MREIKLIERNVAWPVKFTNSFGSNFVYIQTISTTTNDYSITALRLAKPALGSNYAEFPSTVDGGFVAYDINSTSIIQIGGAETLSKRVYYDPILIVTANITDSMFKKTFTYGLTINTPKTHTTFSTDLEVINFQASINAKGDSTTKISLPTSTNDLSVDIDADNWFNGSISHY